jgi:hypothetical protein
MGRTTVDAVKIERAEKMIRVLFELGDWPGSALRHMSVDDKAFSAFIEHSMHRIRAMYPDIDPRHEAAIVTMLTHMLFVGIAIGRDQGYSEDSGLIT